ncbi:MAG TPA: IclR family transcriptional regulator, partial [Gemmatimonadaceae bacterium]|nr:IclR family transcriptional regulator [Gemmatimonadaceae bacterium]
FSFDDRELGVLQVAEILERPKSTVSRWLSAMEHADFLERDPVSSRYRLSLRLAALGEVARQTTTLQRSARPLLSWLAERTGETANLTVLAGLEAVNVEVADSPRPVMHLGWVGRRLPVHATASGKVLLAHAAPALVARVVARKLRRFTPETITRATEFRKELQLVRSRGYATVWAELEPDLAAVASPVRDHRGVVVAAMAIGGPVSRCKPDRMDALAKDVLHAGDSLSEKMGYRERGR